MKRILLFLLLSMNITASFSQQNKENNWRKLGASMPAISLKDRLDKHFSEKNIIPERNFLLIMFNPTCGHCIDAAKLVRENIQMFDSNTVYFMAASDMMEYLDEFAAASNFRETRTVYLGVDENGILKDLYNYNNLPQINVYDKDRKLIKTLNGDLALKYLREYLY